MRCVHQWLAPIAALLLSTLAAALAQAKSLPEHAKTN